jgi:uncharacterized protein YutE (UPF0331/DUF86 family)
VAKLVTKRKLDVFLSSEIAEFRRPRSELARMICRAPFLECSLLETRGAATRNVVESSIKAARDADIYVGIFGKNYSATTIREYHEAVRRRKPCFTYVKKVKNQDERVSNFVVNDLAGQFKYHKFKSNKELKKQIKHDLNSFLYETLVKGLERIQRDKREAQDVATSRTTKLKRIKEKPEDRYISLVNDATQELAQGQYLQTVILSSMAIELALREKAKLIDPTETERRPIGWTLSSLQKKGLLSGSETATLREVFYLRNAAVHEGRVPSQKSAEWVLQIAKKFSKETDKASDVSYEEFKAYSELYAIAEKIENESDRPGVMLSHISGTKPSYRVHQDTIRDIELILQKSRHLISESTAAAWAKRDGQRYAGQPGLDQYQDLDLQVFLDDVKRHFNKMKGRFSKS